MSDQRTHLPDDTDEEVGRLLGHATPRLRPHHAAEEAAYDALHAEWQELTRRRRRRRDLAGIGVAAALLAGVAIGFALLQSSDNVRAAAVATIARVEGSQVTLRDENSLGQRIARDVGALFVGQRLSTGAGSRIALAWHSGGSLRINEHTRVELVSEHSVRLLGGSLYFDSSTSGGEAAALSIQTPAGEVLHTGTQFMLDVRGEELVLSVREGQVKVTGDDFELTVEAGEQLDIGITGPAGRRPIQSYAGAWKWAENLAPLVALDGRTAREIVGWAARETGRSIVYDSAATEAATRATVVRGLDERSPSDTLAVLPLLTDLDFKIHEGTIVISSR
jgi:ferric-dicitrate binding protein FerR (iron transport regulator)